MKVLFDHQVFAWQRFGGISRYFAEIVRGVRRVGHEAVLPDDFFSENIHLQEIAGIEPRVMTRFSFKGKTLLQNWLGRSRSLHALDQERPDVFHPTYFDPYFLPEIERRGIPFVLTVHDMIHELFGHGGGFLSLDALVVPGKKLLAERAAAIICVSENTRRDLLEIYPHIAPEKVHVAWHGNSLKPNLQAPMRLELPDEYVLFVGNRGGYKNFDGFVRGIAPVLASRKHLQVVFAGSTAFSAPEVDFLHRVGILERALHVPFRNDAELAEIYRRALCFVFPSRYEGFGIPVLESFACGCPAVLNESSSLPEVGGSAALYFRENDPGSLAASIESLLNSEEKSREMRRSGFEQLRQFTWENSVERHLEIYGDALKR